MGVFIRAAVVGTVLALGSVMVAVATPEGSVTRKYVLAALGVALLVAVAAGVVSRV